jgi:hypothetical protein
MARLEEMAKSLLDAIEDERNYRLARPTISPHVST